MWTTATSGSSSAKPFFRMTALWVTAASPEATLSLEFFGPWQAPAMNTPSTTVSTGRSFGWISLKNPSLPTGSLRTPISSSFSARDHAGDQDDEVGRDGQLLAAGQQVAARSPGGRRTSVRATVGGASSANFR